MKTIFVFGLVLFAALATNVASYPVFDDATFDEVDNRPTPAPADNEPAPQEEVVSERRVRVRRVTCDLFSFQSTWVTPNHAPCAAKCLALFRGYVGGTCQGGVCHCR